MDDDIQVGACQRCGMADCVCARDFSDKTRSICTSAAPMPKGDAGRWYHPDAKCDGEEYNGLSGGGDYEHYTCPNCGKGFYVELPD